IDGPADLSDLDEFLAKLPPVAADRVLLMPQGTDLVELEAKEAWLEPYSRSRGFVYCPRKHIEWYGAVRGT
ncbi:MAG TPA: radical SAM protein, partial [Pirellulales bacterium]